MRVLRGAPFALLAGVGLCGAAQAVSPPALLPQTGQTTCYGERDGAVVACGGTGQNGETRTGVAWPDPRFKDEGGQAIVDRLTGLVWSRDANPAGGPRTWQEALDDIKALNAGTHLGRSDWRLPNVGELGSLVNTQPNLAEWLQSQGFRNLQVDYYWTSTTYATHPRYAWSVDIYGGIVAGHDKADACFVWPVRQGAPGAVSLPQTGQTDCHDRSGTTSACAGTGQDGDVRDGVAWPSPRFVGNAEGTVSDRLTGLEWTREGQAPGPAVCRPGTRMTLQAALQFVKCLNANTCLGRSDWRLPNRNELASLVHRGQADSAAWLNASGFSGVQSDSYWSSSAFTYNPGNWWSVNLHDGAVTTHARGHGINVWPVRGGGQ